MALFDFIGSGPDQLSLSEVLSALPAVAGPVLMARGRKLGLPIGMGLTAFGGLGELLAKKQAAYGHQQGLVKALQSLSDPLKGTGLKPTDIAPESQGALKPDFGTFATNVLQGGGSPAEAESLWKGFSQQVKPMFRIGSGQEEAFDPASGQTLYQMPKGDYTSSFKPETGKGKGTFAEFQAAHPELSIDQQIERYKALGEKPPAPQMRLEETPEGRPAGVFYGFNKDTHKMEYVPTVGDPYARPGTAEGTVPAKLDTTLQKQVDAVKNAEIEFPVLRSAIKQLPPTSREALYSEYAKYRSGGLLGEVDPRYAEYFAQIGQLKGDLLGAASGARQSVPLMNYVKSHIPNETDMPNLTLQKMNSFEMGRFKALLENAGLKPEATTGTSLTGSPPPAPPFQVNKTYLKDGQWYVSDPAGKFYQYDGTKWVPL